MDELLKNSFAVEHEHASLSVSGAGLQPRRCLVDRLSLLHTHFPALPVNQIHLLCPAQSAAGSAATIVPAISPRRGSKNIYQTKTI